MSALAPQAAQNRTSPNRRFVPEAVIPALRCSIHSLHPSSGRSAVEGPRPRKAAWVQFEIAVAALAFEQDLVAAAVSTSLVPICASSLPPRRHTSTPVGDSLRLISAQFYTTWRYLR